MPSPKPAICICQEGHCDDACEVCADADVCPYAEELDGRPES